MTPTFDITIVLTIKAETEEEAAEKLLDLTGLEEDNLPPWSAIVIRELKA